MIKPETLKTLEKEFSKLLDQTMGEQMGTSIKRTTEWDHLFYAKDEEGEMAPGSSDFYDIGIAMKYYNHGFEIEFFSKCDVKKRIRNQWEENGITINGYWKFNEGNLEFLSADTTLYKDFDGISPDTYWRSTLKGVEVVK